MFNKLGSKGLFGRCTENDFDRHLRARQADKQLAPFVGRQVRQRQRVDKIADQARTAKNYRGW